MANRLEGNSNSWERQQIKAQIRELFTAQEQQTAGRKKKFSRSGRVMAKDGEKLGYFSSQESKYGFSNNKETGVIGGEEKQGWFGSQDWGKFGKGALGVGLGAAAFLPAMYDMFRSRDSEQLNVEDYYNPQYNRALSLYNKGAGLMADRRHDPGRELEAAEQANAVYQQQIQNLPTSTGGLQNRLAGASSRLFGQRSGILRDTQNINRGYEGQEAQYLAGMAGGIGRLGSERAGTRFSIDDWNQRSEGMRRNIRANAYSGFSRGAQNLQLMGNMRDRDYQRTGILPSYGGGMYNYDQEGIHYGGQPMDPYQRRRYVRGYS